MSEFLTLHTTIGFDVSLMPRSVVIFNWSQCLSSPIVLFGSVVFGPASVAIAWLSSEWFPSRTLVDSQAFAIFCAD